jgi:murein L,D-transpeptidase YcbB/YkuD
MKIPGGLRALLLVPALATLGCESAAKPTAPDLSAALRAAVQARTPSFAVVEDDERGHHLWQEEQRFYKQNGYQLVWSDGKRPRGQVDGLIRALRGAGDEGLESGDYHVDDLDAARNLLTSQQAVDFDLRATYAYLRYGWDLSRGTIDPEDVDPQWHAAPRHVDLHNALVSGLGENDIGESLRHLAPASPQYQGLKHQLVKHRASADGDAVHQIAMNMDRWRWLPDDLGSRYILVNIPAFRLDVIEDGKSVLDMKVVTGKKDSPTPVLVDRLTTVVFSPYWNIPADIVEKEILPKVEKDPSYLEKNNIEAVDASGRYRQRPGPGNSLGQVKFLFPNHYNVYLHDTPAQALFDRVERDFSHGCVRLDRPADLAKYILRDQPEWTEARITEAMQSGTEQSVPLKQPLPIYLVYFTVWEANGALQRVPDVYGLDRRHNTATTNAQ